MWLRSLLIALSPDHLLFLTAGSLLGLVIGAAPGLGPAFGLALFLAMTFRMEPSVALIFLSALYASSVYGGSLSAILLNTPGTPGSIATCFDGYEMTKKGEGGKALGAAAISSFVGGIAGVLALMLLGPLLAEISLKFGPAEFFMLALAGLSLVAVASKGDLVRGLMMGGLGLLLSFFGRNVITGASRFALGTLYLEDGIKLVPVVIGVFAFGQAITLSLQQGSISQRLKVTGVWQGVTETLKKPVTLLRASLVGVFIGILPGLGINMSNFIAYLVEKNASKHPETFGKGEIRGVIAPETANNASTSASLIPAFGLGVPGGSASALFLSALMIHGLTPGYGFFSTTGELFPTIIWGMFFSQVMFLVMGLAGSSYFVRITQMPNALLVPVIMVLSFIGAFAYRGRVLDVLLMVICGVAGYYLIMYKYPLPCLVLGLVLGDMAEANLNRALRISRGSLRIFVDNPISLALVILIAGTLLVPAAKKIMVRFSDGKAS